MAAARAAARRQAILSSRGDRLAKLTSSARGEDPGGVYAHDDPPLPTVGTGLENSVGDETAPPTLPADAPRSQRNAGAGAPSAWGPAQQEEFMRAFMGGAGAEQPGPMLPPSMTAIPNPDANFPSVPEDPLSALLASFGGSAGGPAGAINGLFSGKGGPFTQAETPPPQPRTLVQKLIPVLHLLSMLAMLVWFLAWKEPEAFTELWLQNSAKVEGSEQDVAMWAYNGKELWWRRWAMLARGSPSTVGLVVSPVSNFFWAFTTLQLALHSLRLFYQRKEYRPPMLLQIALPYLPAPLPQAILTLLKYSQMVSMVIDDLSILVFGIGLVIFVSNWAT